MWLRQTGQRSEASPSRSRTAIQSPSAGLACPQWGQWSVPFLARGLTGTVPQSPDAVAVDIGST